MKRTEPIRARADLLNEGFLGYIFCICSLFLLFRPPATWSEIFFLASLKRKPVTIAHEGPEFHLRLPDEDLILFKSPYLPEWTISFFEHMSNWSEMFFPAAAEALTGQGALIASRVTAFFLAIVAVLLFRRRRKNNFQSQHSPDGQEFAFPVSPAFLLLVSLPLFVRWGALEQLCVLIALVALTLLPPAESKLKVDHRVELVSVLIFSLALAAACSRTWSYSLLFSAVPWLLLESRKTLRLKRVIVLCASAVAVFIFLFLVPSTFESLVSHWTQRWLYLNEPRYLPDQWLGDGMIWKTISGFIAVLSARRLILRLAINKTRNAALFPEILSLTAALHIGLVQTVPVSADILLLTLIYLFGPRSDSLPANVQGRPRSLVQTLTRVSAALPALYLVVVGLACLVAFVLMLTPATRILPDLQATADGIVLLAIENKFLTITFALLGTLTLLFFVFMRAFGQKSEHSKAERVRRSSRSEWAKAGLISAAALALCVSELRSAFVWQHLKKTLDGRPDGAQIFYLPKMEPLIRILPQKPHHMRMVTVFEGGTFLVNQNHSVLLVPTAVSEVCHAAQWNVDAKNGIFALCDTGQGTISHLLPLN